MEEPTGDAARLDSTKSFVGWSQTFDLGSVIGILTILR
jgi:hypothetical protein